ncbi:hypothetical protein ACHAXS_002447 [Conticribra weissflogii]
MPIWLECMGTKQWMILSVSKAELDICFWLPIFLLCGNPNYNLRLLYQLWKLKILL